ncbi:MAG: glyoxalase [Planctomycetaceae bacterium]|jgi:catechol 2,3-dioxygenase-like lactoylglutathione lyase family enzyme|nr:glyoxalase [Planctomycetaceae bacterium]MDP7275869.1 VOC family protein [Planctomycetaceae bacterium]
MPPALPIHSTNHVARVTRDLEASTEFYRDVLGFQPIDRPDFGFPGAWLYNYDLQIHLIAATDETDPEDCGISLRTDHVAFHVDDIQESQRLLEERGIPFATNYVEDTDVTQVFFKDPDGNHIELGTYPCSKEWAQRAVGPAGR